MGFFPHVFFYILKEEFTMALENFKYSIIENIDYTFEEKGNQFGAVRNIQWGDSDKR